MHCNIICKAKWPRCSEKKRYCQDLVTSVTPAQRFTYICPNNRVSIPGCFLCAGCCPISWMWSQYSCRLHWWWTSSDRRPLYLLLGLPDTGSGPCGSLAGTVCTRQSYYTLNLEGRVGWHKFKQDLVFSSYI